VLQPPVLAGANFTQVLAKLYESHIPLLIHSFSLSEYLVDSSQHAPGPSFIEYGRRREFATPQVR